MSATPCPRGARRAILSLWVAALATSPCLGCEDAAPPPLSPPRCEPDNEVQLERGLKRGYRALAEGHPEQAREAFRAVLRQAPGHPQAEAGIAASRERAALARRGTRREGAPIWVGGQPIWTPLAIRGDRYRFEDRAEESALAHELRLCPAAPAAPPFQPRRAPGGGALPTDDPVPAVEAIDLIVLRDARAVTTHAAFLRLLAAGESVHFSIDWDGGVYQHLDLARAAVQPGLAREASRSVVVALVNPTSPDLPPAPRGAGAVRHLVRGTVQGHEVQAWSYTAAQVTSLNRLLAALRGALPKVPARVPRDDRGEIPRAALARELAHRAQGVAGALHLDAQAQDPGPALDWGGVARALER